MAASVHFGAPLIALQHGLVLPLALAEECCPEKVVPRLAANVLSARVENDDVVLVGNKQMRTLLRTVPAIHFGLGQNIGRCPSASLEPRSWVGWQALLGSHIRERQRANPRATEARPRRCEPPGHALCGSRRSLECLCTESCAAPGRARSHACPLCRHRCGTRPWDPRRRA